MENKIIAKGDITINAPVQKVWKAITTPETVQTFMLGMKPVSTWEKGTELRWIGRHEEKPNDNARGIITVMEENKELQFTFYYPGYGYPDESAFYNTVVFRLQSASEGVTTVSVEQGDFSVFKEGQTFAEHSQSFWTAALAKLKEILEP